MNFDWMRHVHLRPCAPILQSGVQPPFPYSLTSTNLYELSFSETKLTHQSRQRERDGNDEFEQRYGFGDDTISASVVDAVQSWGLGLMGYPDRC